MEKQRNTRTLILVTLIVAVLGLTIAYASMSKVLTIKGSTGLTASTWDIHFENLSEVETTGAATATKPTLSDTTITGFEATVTKPGDSVTFEFDIVNAGTMDATIKKLTIPLKYKRCYDATKLTDDCVEYDFDSDGDIDMNDISRYRNMINYNLYYVDTNKTISEKDTLKAGETRRVRLMVKYNESSTILPKNNFTITDGDIVITYEQD
jgi:hypothetical protein